LAKFSIGIIANPGIEPEVILMEDNNPICSMTPNEAHGLALIIQKMIFKSTPDIEIIDDGENKYGDC
jgi:hypothetical protein